MAKQMPLPHQHNNPLIVQIVHTFREMINKTMTKAEDMELEAMVIPMADKDTTVTVMLTAAQQIILAKINPAAIAIA